MLTRKITFLKPLRRLYSMKSEFSKHASLLNSLGLDKENNGVYNGEWSGKGELVHSINPATNQIIASVRTGTPEELKKTLDKIEAIKPMWRDVINYLFILDACSAKR